jgi:thiamine-phosphate pyrophosphorylase
MTKPSPYNINGLYVVTPDTQEVNLLCTKVRSALDGGAKLVQYRNKSADSHLRLRQATALLALCRAYGVPLIINDHLDLCVTIDADGLHLGATDCDWAAAKRLIGPNKILGASCYNQLELARKAQTVGASYAAFGACFSSETEPSAVNAPLSLFQEAKKVLNIPLVAIGGITLQNAPSVIEAGADALAVVTDVFLDDDIQGISQRYTALFQPSLT